MSQYKYPLTLSKLRLNTWNKDYEQHFFFNNLKQSLFRLILLLSCNEILIMKILFKSILVITFLSFLFQLKLRVVQLSFSLLSISSNAISNLLPFVLEANFSENIIRSTNSRFFSAEQKIDILNNVAMEVKTKLLIFGKLFFEFCSLIEILNNCYSSLP